MSVRYAIIENEYFALAHLKSVLAAIRPKYDLVFTSESVEESIAFFKKKPTLDFIFMDIELVDGNCFEIFSQVEIEIPIIFTTAYNQFAIQAFKVNSIEYILKPVSEQAVQGALEKWEKIIRVKNDTVSYKNLTTFFEEKQTKDRILITKGDTYSFIATTEIAYLVSEDKYILLVSFSGKKRLTNYTNLSQAEEELDKAQFFKVSRNSIVNLNAIDNVEKYFNGRLLINFKSDVKVSNKIVVSAARKDVFLNWLGGNIKN